MTNPYGTDPGSQPQGLGDPGNQGPGFVAPGRYGQPQYGPPSNPPAQPYGLPGPYGPPPPYPPPYAQLFGAPAPAQAQGPQPQYVTPRRRLGPSKAAVVVVLACLVAGISYVGSQLAKGGVSPVTQATPTWPMRTAAGRSDTSSPAASSSAGTGTLCVAGDTITTPDFVATVPRNWACDGDVGDISLTSTREDAIWVDHEPGTGDLAADCRSQIAGMGTVTTLPKETWGGVSTLSYVAVASDGIFGVRCAVVGGQTWYLTYFPLDTHDDATVRADVTTVMSTWVWK